MLFSFILKLPGISFFLFTGYGVREKEFLQRKMGASMFNNKKKCLVLCFSKIVWYLTRAAFCWVKSYVQHLSKMVKSKTSSVGKASVLVIRCFLSRFTPPFSVCVEWILHCLAKILSAMDTICTFWFRRTHHSCL